ncbi:MAG: septum formation protein Maf [Planctomycetes bacterium]|nr:septum formation protein Maf [Planctomycetota bacterium]
MPGLVLASASPYRRVLLERLRLPFTCTAPNVDEAAALQALRDPAALARELAEQKARAVAAAHPGAIVIGSDQVATIDGEVLDKPGSAERCRQQLRRLQGREHLLLTAVAIVHPGGLAAFVDVATLRMRPLDAGEIERYVAADAPFDCAGSYRIESLGIALFAAIACEDHTAIVGLPLLRLAAELRRLGCAVP